MCAPSKISLDKRHGVTDTLIAPRGPKEVAEPGDCKPLVNWKRGCKPTGAQNLIQRQRGRKTEGNRETNGSLGALAFLAPTFFWGVVRDISGNQAPSRPNHGPGGRFNSPGAWDVLVPLRKGSLTCFLESHQRKPIVWVTICSGQDTCAPESLSRVRRDSFKNRSFCWKDQLECSLLSMSASEVQTSGASAR